MAVRLECAIKNYHWGKVGEDSTVAKLAQNNQEEFVVDPNQTYAELWMGTLATGPSKVKSDDVLLSDYISKSPDFLGKNITSRFGEQLPFLFKILSVNQSLSIQAHPNKKHAEELHDKYPNIYQDPNHKPEMALALTEFEGMCGFRPLHEIQCFIKGVPELAGVLGESAVRALIEVAADDASAVKSAIKQAFSSLMRCDPAVISRKVLELVNRLSLTQDACLDETMSELVHRLNTQFPCDVGIFSVFFLNHMMLKPGEAMYLAANIPHAYLSGDCVECMATSDNVVRAGLTPKLKDVDTLIEMLDYSPKTCQENLMESLSREDDSCVRVFKPDVPDFAVHEIKVEKATCYSLSKEDSASIAIVTRGEGSSDIGQLKPGHVVFIPANEIFNVNTESDSLIMYRALCMS